LEYVISVTGGTYIKKKIILVGAGGLARMIYSWLPDFLEDGGEWEAAGFLSDKLDDLQGYDYDAPVLETIRDYRPAVGDLLVMAIADPRNKLIIAGSLEQRGGKFINLVHPTAIIGKNVQLGRGCVICPNAVLTCDIKMGNFVLVNLAVTIGHDVQIGDGCTLNAHADVTGFTELKEGVFLGSHAVLTPSVKVKEYAKIGAGSVALRTVQPGTAVFGVPAKKI
jgi:sugar O-acyltransferase (sialic acid O-acetyltransferase NeuD family)